jgi:iron complex outermembrane receptor protein
MKQKIFLFSACMIFTMAGLVFSQEMPYRLDDIVVTASRIETPLREAAGNVTVISKENIEESGAQTLIDVFSKEPGVFTNNLLNNPKTSTIDIRGYGEAASQNTLFLIDGRRINNIDNSGADLSQIPLEIIERIEVYRGPSSVLFGDNAVGGVANIILKKGEGKPKLTLGTTAGSYDFYKPQLTFYGKEDKFSYFVLSSMSDLEGYRHNNALHTKDVFANFTFDIFKNLAVTAKVGHHRDNYGLPGNLLWRTDMGIFDRKDSKEPYNNGSTEDNFADLNVDAKISESVTISLGGSYRNRHAASHFEGAGWFSDGQSSLKTLSFTPSININTPVFGRKNIFTGGFDYYKYPTSSSAFGGAWSNTEGDIKKTDSGFYANDKMYLIPDLFIEAGYRLHKAQYEFDYVDHITTANSYKNNKNEQKEAYRASINYSFKKNGSLFLTYAKGFRFPTTDEFIGFDPTTFAPFFNPEIKVQTTEEINLGLRWNPTQRIGGNLTLFKTINHDEIFYNPRYRLVWGSWLGRNENYERTKREGFETNLYFILGKGLKLSVYYSYIKAKFDGGIFDNNSIPLVPANKFATNISYSFNDFILNLSMVCIGNRRAVSDQLNDQRKMPGFTTFDSSIIYKHGPFNVLFAIKNLTGTKYSEYGAYSPNRNDIGLYPAPERQYLMKLEYTFEK